MKKLIVVLIVLMIGFAIYSVKIEYIEIIGNEKYSSEEIEKLIFDQTKSKRTIFVVMSDIFTKHKELPNITNYTLVFVSPNHLQIIVEENPIIGCIFYMSSFMYFDRTGMVVYSKNYLEEGIPKIEGISFRNIVVGQKLDVRNKKEFNRLANISACIRKTDLKVDVVTFNSLEDITIRLGQIYVHLGDAINIETQISILAEVYPQLSDKAGELDLSMAKENVINESYIFKKDVGR